VTYRSKEEGGDGNADPETVANYLITAVQAGADLVDVELNMPEKWRKKIIGSKDQCGMVVSSHFKDHTPSRSALHSVFNESLVLGADIVKIVTWAQNWEDNLRVLELIPQALDQGIKISAFCMGPMGRISRIFSHLMGAHLTFASLEPGQESASGQIPIQKMKEILDYFIV
jgi:3-dehydroquinate dehydratase type I